MTDLIDYIDSQIKSCVGEVNQFGLCHLVGDTEEQYPATLETIAKKVTPDDRYLITSYHRLLPGDYDAREDLSFGRRVTAQNNQKVRMVVFVKFGEPQTKIDDIINAMPDTFEFEGYRHANVSKSISLIRDSNAVWEDEYTESYKDKYQMRFHIYAVEYELQYIKCNVCV